MKCSAFIATSIDGFIARPDGSVDWLHAAGDRDADMTGQEDMGFNEYISSVDCLIMGRKCMEVISAMELSDENWPYGDLRIIVLSNTLEFLPLNMKNKAELYSGNISDLLAALKAKGYEHAYIDGGTTIRNFMESSLIDEITITKAPVFLEAGIPLFHGGMPKVDFTEVKTVSFPNGFTQVKYKINYSK